MTVTESTYPAANSVNNGARRGLRLISRAGRDESYSEQTVRKVAKFATKLWRTINGEDVTLLLPSDQKKSASKLCSTSSPGICATDGRLRISLLSLWQWLWPTNCYPVLRVQQWDDYLKQKQKQISSKTKMGTITDDNTIMSCTDEERKASEQEEQIASDLTKIVMAEIDRQKYRGEMAAKAYEYWKSKSKKQKDLANSAALSSGLGHPLPVVQKDNAWKLGGWAASASQQRRTMNLDGGSKVHKVRLTVKSSMNEG